VSSRRRLWVSFSLKENDLHITVSEPCVRRNTLTLNPRKPASRPIPRAAGSPGTPSRRYWMGLSRAQRRKPSRTPPAHRDIEVALRPIYTFAMRRFGSAVAILLMCLMIAPAVACIAGLMTSGESACCRSMHGQCGNMATQSCCRPEVRNDLSQLPSPVTSAPPALPLIIESIVYPPAHGLSALQGYRQRLPCQHSPPGLLIVSTAVLRI